MRRPPDIEFAAGARPAGTSLQHWLYNEIRDAILSGRLKAGVRLPASRELARQIGVARGTVLAVYEQLAMEGYLAANVGRGTFVAARLPDTPSSMQSAYESPCSNALVRLSATGQRLANTPFPVKERPWPPPAFRPNQPDIAAFPFKLWYRLAARRSRLVSSAVFADGDALGYPPLRDVIAQHLRQSRAITCTGDQIAIVGSVQQILDIVARLVLDAGDTAWMEDPGFPGARMVLAGAGAKIVGIPVDEHGIDVATGRRLAPNARLAYVTAGRQAPLGMPLALDRRLALLSWAKENGALVIEDDYDSEFRFHGAPLAAMRSHDLTGQVVYAGTFSKMLFPALRLAFAVLPDWLVDPFRRAASLTMRYQPPAAQAVLHDFIAEGHFGRHMRRMRLHYAERAETLQNAVARRLGAALTIPPIAMGLDTPAFLPFHCDATQIAEMAGAAGVEVRPLSAYQVDHPAPTGLQLGFAAVPPKAIEAGVVTLARVIEDSQRQP